MAQSFKASSLKGGYGRNAGKRWRAGDVAELRALVNRGLPVRTIGLKLGRPDSAIRAKAGALGLSVAEDAGFRGDMARPAHRPAPRSSLHGPASECSQPAPVSRPRQLELFG